jgi:TRAP-type mannitol/chloroaromatic compound transport system permease small subunit
MERKRSTKEGGNFPIKALIFITFLFSVLPGCSEDLTLCNVVNFMLMMMPTRHPNLPDSSFLASTKNVHISFYTHVILLKIH